MTTTIRVDYHQRSVGERYTCIEQHDDSGKLIAQAHVINGRFVRLCGRHLPSDFKREAARLCRDSIPQQFA